MKTYNAKPGEIERDWLIVDAEGKTLGRLATQIAERLRGKGKTVYTPHVDTGDFVIVVNAEKIAVTGNKLDEKIYYRHSGYPGGLRERTLARAARPAADRGAAQGRQGHAAAQQARSRAADEAQDLCRAGASPHGTSANNSRGLNMSTPAQYLGTGKRKTSVARVILRPGDGATWINGKTIEEYFPRMVHRMLATAPLKVAGLEGQYDLRVRLHGGGPSGQAGAMRHGIARALVEVNPELRPPAAAGRLPDARRAHRRAQEGRTAQGAQGAAVQQALDPRSWPAGTSAPMGCAASWASS